MMGLFSIIAKTVALPIRVADLPFKIMRKVVDEEESGILEQLADRVEDSIEELGE